MKATAQDYVWSVEPRQNNSTMLWQNRNSELGAFCTADTALVSQLDKIAEDMKMAKYLFTSNIGRLTMVMPRNNILGW